MIEQNSNYLRAINSNLEFHWNWYSVRRMLETDEMMKRTLEHTVYWFVVISIKRKLKTKTINLKRN